MQTVSIQLPPIEAEGYVDVDVTVNGKKKQFKFRVAVFEWSEWRKPSEPRAVAVKRMIDSYDKDWQLLQIGNPTELSVPLMFRRIH
ncbi:MAG TPA: hypothetical protein VII11_10520 [Bacteroidota bacterium]